MSVKPSTKRKFIRRVGKIMRKYEKRFDQAIEQARIEFGFSSHEIAEIYTVKPKREEKKDG